MENGAGRMGGKMRGDRAARSTLISAAVFCLLPMLWQRFISAEATAILAMPLAAVMTVFLLSETMWERSAFRGVRLLLRADRQKEAAACKRRMALFGALTGAVFSALLPALHPFVFGVASSRMGSRWIMVVILPGMAALSALGAKRGYLRARGAGAELSVARILQNVLLPVLSCVFGAGCRRYGGKVDALMLTDNYASVYGAVGAMAGMSLALVIVWLFLSLTEMRYRMSGVFSVRAEKARGGYAYVTAEGIFALLFFALSLSEQWLWFHTAPLDADGAEVISAAQQTALWGRYVGAVFAPTVLLSLLLCLPFLLSVHQMHVRLQREGVFSVQDRFAKMVRHAAIFSFPAALSASALAGPLTSVFAGRPDELAASLFRAQICAAPVMCFGFLLTILFVRLGGLRAVLISGAAGVAAHVAAALAVSAAGKGLFACVIASLLGFFVFTALTALFLSAALSYRQEWLHGFVIPLLSAVISALPAFALSAVLSGVIGEVLTIVLMLAVDDVVYMTLLTIFHGVTEYELYRIPGGRLFVGLARLFWRGA